MSEFVSQFGLDPADKAVRALVLGLPVAVLVTLLLILFLAAKTGAKRKRLSASLNKDSAGPSAFVSGHDMEMPRPRATTAPVASAAEEAVPDVSVAEQPSPEAPAQALKEAAVARPLENSVETVKAKLSEALSRNAKSSLAPLYLELAWQQRAAGNETECLSALRSAAGMAAQHGPRSAHAEARLELAEAAFKAGDLIGACEQWQIARTALHDDGQKEAHARIDKRMRDNGCPTDWVLTDF